MSVPFFTAEGVYNRQRALFERHLDRLFDRCDFVNGSLVTELEDAIRDYTGARHAVAVGNASDGLALALIASGVPPRSEVIVPALTFVSSASSVTHAGARPVFADIDAATYGLDPESVRKAITPATRAMMIVHLFHQPALTPELLAIAKEHDLIVIEDSAESIGMWCDGRHTGLAGRAGVLSFFPTKTLGCFGDGGLLITDDDAVADECRRLRDHGREPDETGAALRPGFSSRMDSIQAAVLLARVEALDREIESRARLAELYGRRLAALSTFVKTPRFAPRTYPSNGVWYVYVVECERRDELGAFLASKGILTETYYPLPLHLQPAFAAWGHRKGDLPVAEGVCSRTLALPLFPDMEEAQAHFVCDAIAEFYGGAK
jgi:dTDP-4-amino-4,6-dideoxygalactose transaminase